MKFVCVSFLDIRIWGEYRVSTFELLFGHSNWGWISNFDIQNPILIVKLRPNIAFWHSKILFWHSNSGRTYGIFTFEIISVDFLIGPNIVFYFKFGILFNIRSGTSYRFLYTKFYFDIGTLAEYGTWCIRTFKNHFFLTKWTEYPLTLTINVLFWHWNCGLISYFEIWHSTLIQI